MSANPGLGYEDTPPFSVPLRFFLTAPLFGLAAGGVVLVDGGLLQSRWTPGALAVVHLVAAGFMLQVMLGALLQILPVVAGARFTSPPRLAALIHVTATPGGAALAWGLGHGAPSAILGGAALLGAALLIFIGTAWLAVRRAPAPASAAASATPRDLRLALFGLLAAGGFGVLLAFVLGRGVAPPAPFSALAFPTLVDLHAGWAWLGWAGMLLAATSWVVVPMFQITPPYPGRLTARWGLAVIVVLLAWTASLGAGFERTAGMLGVLLLALGAAFAGTTLRVQAQSRRATPDAPFRAFQSAMLALLAGIGALAVAQVSEDPRWTVAAGILILHGGFTAAIESMLYKIVPFLAWLHLTQARRKAPNMKKLLPAAPVRGQLLMHGAALGALLASLVVGALAPLAGMLLIGEFAWLLANLLRVVRTWRRTMAG